jgi:multiple sugar transport system ATP-binding protein
VQMRTEIKALHQRLGTTTIYVTHDQVEAMTMADRIVVMRDGIVEQVGAPLELYDFPDNLFVASFIGSPAMNFIEGRIEQAGAGQVFRSARGAALPLDPAQKFADGLESVYGVRPEHLSIAQGDDGVAADIHIVEPTGSETQVTLDIEGDVLVGMFRERIGSASDRSLRIVPEVAKVHLFDKGTGQRVAGASGS